MIKFWIKFDEEKAAANGRTANQLQEDAEAYLAKFPSVRRIGPYEWQDDTEEALGIFGELDVAVCEDNDAFRSLERMGWNVDGEVEDIIAAELAWRARHRALKKKGKKT